MNCQKPREMLRSIGLWSGRGFLPAALLIAQFSLLVQYLVQYEGRNAYYWLYLLLLPVLVPWFVVIRWPNTQNDRISLLWLLLLVYTWWFLTPMVALIFGMVVIENKLKTSKFFGPNVLNNTLCMTPFQLLFMLMELQVPTANNPGEYLVSTLSYTLVLDLFDGIEMLEILLSESNRPHQIPKEFKIVMLAAVCGFFILSPLELLQVKHKEGADGNSRWKSRKKVSYIRCALQVLINVLFLLLRLVLWWVYGRDAAIFMAKNVLSLMLLVRKMSPSTRNRQAG